MNRILLVILIVLISSLNASCAERHDIFISSSIGNDDNSGLTEDKPLRTISAAYRKGQYNDLYLKAGDTFYVSSTLLLNRKMTRYGEGCNPLLCGYKRVETPCWERVKQNIWKLNLTSDIFTGVIINGSSIANNVGCIHEYDIDMIHGHKYQYLDELSEDWDFFQTEKLGGEVDPSEFDWLYLYYSGDPNKLKLEFSTGEIAVTMRQAQLIGVNICGYGFGISAGSDVVIRDCHIDAIGGRTLMTSSSFVCDGNGIGIWVYSDKDTENCLVEGCYISRIYDSGVCLSGSDGHPTTARNITVENNLFVCCCQGWEDFLRNKPTKSYENCLFKNNIVVFSGDTGFGYPKNRFKRCHVLSNNYTGDKKMRFEDNMFIGGNFYCSGGFNNTYTSNVWENNTCFISADNYLVGNYSGTKDVVYVTVTGRGINDYRALTEDRTTEFKIVSSSVINKKGSQQIKRYLKNHQY